MHPPPSDLPANPAFSDYHTPVDVHIDANIDEPGQLHTTGSAYDHVFANGQAQRRATKRRRRRRSSAIPLPNHKRRKQSSGVGAWSWADFTDGHIYDADDEDSEDEDSDEDTDTGNSLTNVDHGGADDADSDKGSKNGKFGEEEDICLGEANCKVTDDAGTNRQNDISLDNAYANRLPEPATPIKAQHQPLFVDSDVLNSENNSTEQTGEGGVGYDDHGIRMVGLARRASTTHILHPRYRSLAIVRTHGGRKRRMLTPTVLAVFPRNLRRLGLNAETATEFNLIPLNTKVGHIYWLLYGTVNKEANRLFLE